jgi:hypothetical protein
VDVEMVLGQNGINPEILEERFAAGGGPCAGSIEAICVGLRRVASVLNNERGE